MAHASASNQPWLSDDQIAWINYVIADGHPGASQDPLFTYQRSVESNEANWRWWLESRRQALPTSSLDQLCLTPSQSEFYGRHIFQHNQIVGRQVFAVNESSPTNASSPTNDILAQPATGGVVVRVGEKCFQLTCAWMDLHLVRWPSVCLDGDVTSLGDQPDRNARREAVHLDYRLLEIPHNDSDFPLNSWQMDHQRIVIGNYDSCPSIETKVFILTSLGARPAVLNPPSRLRHPPTSHPLWGLPGIHALWIRPEAGLDENGLDEDADFDCCLYPQDRGAAVIDADLSGTVYGHVISSSTCGTTWAHMAAITDVFDDVETQWNFKPELCMGAYKIETASRPEKSTGNTAALLAKNHAADPGKKKKTKPLVLSGEPQA